MDINELKALWHEQDSRLENNLRLNNQILFQMKMDRSNSEFRRLMNGEKQQIIHGFILIVVIIYFTAKYSSSPTYLTCGILSFIITAVYFIFAIIRMVGFSKLSCYDESVIKLQKELGYRKKQMFRFRKIEYMLVPILIATLYILGNKVVYNIDISLYSVYNIVKILILSVIGIGIGMWGYRIFYEKRIASAEALLKSIADFENTSD